MQAPVCRLRWFLQVSPGTVCIPAFVHPGWLYLRTIVTVPGPRLTASGAPRASLVVEITQSSMRRQVQSKSKKVLQRSAALEVDPSPLDVKAINGLQGSRHN